MREDVSVARAKRESTPADMIRSLAVILIPLLIITFLFTRNLGDHPVKEVDWRPVLTTARQQAPFPVLAPTGLPEGWRPTQVVWVPLGEPYLNGEPSVRNLWKLGFLTPDDVFIGLSEGDLRPDDLVRDETRAGSPDGQSTVGDQTWQRWVSPDDRTRSLVASSAKATTVVSADLPYEALEAYVSTLSTSG
jgi:hypothetical protein